MAVEKETSNAAEPTAVFLEVLCRSSGKVRRFAPGVKAGFASSLINLKLEPGVPFCLYIEAIKEGEEPISFGPDSVLVIYGNGWKLQTVIDSKGSKRVVDRPVAPTKADTQGPNPSLSGKKAQAPQSVVSLSYIGKILVVFGFMFLLAGIFSLALENLPRLISFINSSLAG
ncbi:hypothetical protein Dimus_023156 [Dionaea muscipula]